MERGADYVVMLHPDYQYDARVIPAAIDILRLGICDVVLGNRIRTRAEALAGGMPWPKYLANRGLSLIENLATGQNLGEWHSGFRAYSRAVLERVPYERNSDDFVFDSQFLFQCVHFGFKLGDIPVPVRYFDEASSINFRRSSVYAPAHPCGLSPAGTAIAPAGGVRCSPSRLRVPDASRGKQCLARVGALHCQAHGTTATAFNMRRGLRCARRALLAHTQPGADRWEGHAVVTSTSRGDGASTSCESVTSRTHAGLSRRLVVESEPIET